MGISDTLGRGFLLCISWMSSCWRPWWDVSNRILLPNSIWLTIIPDWLNLFLRIFSWMQLLSVAEKVWKGIFLSVCWMFYASIFILCSWSWMTSFFSIWIFCYILALSHRHRFFSHRSSVLALCCRIICGKFWVSTLLEKLSVSLRWLAFSSWRPEILDVHSFLPEKLLSTSQLEDFLAISDLLLHPLLL